MIEGGGGLVSLAADEDDFVAGGYIGNVGDVNDGLIHADAPDERGTLTAHKQAEAIAELAIEAVGISHSDECETHGLGGDECAVVSDDGAGRDGSHTDYLRFPTEYGSQFVASLAERDGFRGRESGIVFGNKSIEREARAHHGFHFVACSERRDLVSLSGKKCCRCCRC